MFHSEERDDTCAKEEASRGEYSEVAVDRVVKENGNVENYCKKDYDEGGGVATPSLFGPTLCIKSSLCDV